MSVLIIFKCEHPHLNTAEYYTIKSYDLITFNNFNKIEDPILNQYSYIYIITCWAVEAALVFMSPEAFIAWSAPCLIASVVFSQVAEASWWVLAYIYTVYREFYISAVKNF